LKKGVFEKILLKLRGEAEGKNLRSGPVFRGHPPPPTRGPKKRGTGVLTKKMLGKRSQKPQRRKNRRGSLEIGTEKSRPAWPAAVTPIHRMGERRKAV